MNLVLLGAPGAGKGTQAELLCENYGFDYISTGAILREAISKGTPLGLQAKALIDNGHLVGDDVVIAIVKERLETRPCESGFIFDGFPRNIFQANALSEITNIDCTLLIDVPDSTIYERMASRRVCESCGETLRVGMNVASDTEPCPKCGGKLVTRRDDRPEVVKERLKIYHETTEPVADYYRQKNMLKIIDGTLSPEQIHKSILDALNLKQR